jgi:hypothetical protein
MDNVAALATRMQARTAVQATLVVVGVNHSKIKI